MTSRKAISMEEFGPVSVDYFHGRRVEKVEKCRASKSGRPTFIIHFEGGGEIHNFESEVPTPKAIVGAALTRTIMDSTTKVTRLQFGLEEVVLNPMEYAIRDPNYTKGELVYAQRSTVNMEPPEEPSERVAEGPDEDWGGDEPGV